MTNFAQGQPGDLILPVSDSREILGRALAFGSAAEALEPAEFRDLWRQEVRKMAAGAE
ncbi:MAG TPA: WYL domain-containing protein [Spirochaetia bacterium]|nr:WYL domain-containing protein [Spirochaetia bacterium]